MVSDEQWRVTEALNSKPERKSGDGDEKWKLATLVKPLDADGAELLINSRQELCSLLSQDDH